VQLLLAHPKADINIAGPDGTAIDLAYNGGYEDVADLLISKDTVRQTNQTHPQESSESVPPAAAS
jgi:hypothetical protein